MGQMTHELSWRLECLFELETMPDLPWVWQSVIAALKSSDIEQREIAIAILATSTKSQAKQVLQYHLSNQEHEPWLQRFCKLALNC
jgi:hypothetical protein